MQVSNFLAAILQAHGRVLHEFDEILGRGTLINLLTESSQRMAVPKLPAFKTSTGRGMGSPYEVLEGTVIDLNLPDSIEPFVWNYPLYRAFIEGSIELTDEIVPGKCIDFAVDYARFWMDSLEIKRDLHKKLAPVCAEIWSDFRGKRFS